MRFSSTDIQAMKRDIRPRPPDGVSLETPKRPERSIDFRYRPNRGAPVFRKCGPLRPPRLNDRRFSHPALIGRPSAGGDDRDHVFRDGDFPVPAISQRDATQIGEVDAVIEITVGAEPPGGGDVEDMQGDEVSGAAAVIGGKGDKKTVLGRTDISIGRLLVGIRPYLLLDDPVAVFW